MFWQVSPLYTSRCLSVASQLGNDSEVQFSSVLRKFSAETQDFRFLGVLQCDREKKGRRDIGYWSEGKT
ncbi:hypothetical protein LSAT2_006777 [Lamellibrachia satsuma]|nr:hypothetical protein LSAT2_006777 [Lamellibrachia satsuma]